MTYWGRDGKAVDGTNCKHVGVENKRLNY